MPHVDVLFAFSSVRSQELAAREEEPLLLHCVIRRNVHCLNVRVCLADICGIVVHSVCLLSDHDDVRV